MQHRRRCRTECRVLVSDNERLLTDNLNALVADGWRVTHLASASAGNEEGPDSLYTTVLVERQRRLP